MNVDLVRRPTVRGARTAVLVYEPRRPRGVSLAVGHGYSSSKQNLDPLCGFLASHGFGIASVDFPGHKLGATGGRLESPQDMLDALAAGVAVARDAFGPGPVYSLGHSVGAMTALGACAADPSLAGAISIATGLGRPGALHAIVAGRVVDLRSGYVDGLSLRELMELTEPLVRPALARLAGRPVLYVAAERDAMVSLESARALFDAAPEPKTYVTIASDHTTAGERARAAVLAWLDALHPRLPAD